MVVSRIRFERLFGLQKQTQPIFSVVVSRIVETVINEISTKYPNQVNVVFLNILLTEIQRLVKYYGIAAIPKQVILNKEGKEFFRHTWNFSSEELLKQLLM